MSRDFTAALATIQAPFVIAYDPAGRRGLHAIATAQARHAADTTPPNDIPAVVALCGASAQLAIGLGTFEPDNVHLRSGRCFACAWAVAIDRGTVDDELDLLTPVGDDLVVHSRLLSNPLIARQLCEAIIAQANRADAPAKLDDQRTIRLLADVCAHAPEVLVPLECAEGHCDHWDDSSGTPVLQCPTSLSSIACSTCSTTYDSNDLGIVYLDRGTVAAPCDHLAELAATYDVGGAAARATTP